MSDELKDILSFESNGISDEQLLKYLKGELQGDEKHYVEKVLLDSDLYNDAVEGLEKVSGASRLSAIRHEIETQLAHQLHKKEKVQKRWAIGNMNWMYVFVAAVLIVILIAFAIVIFLLDKA